MQIKFKEVFKLQSRFFSEPWNFACLVLIVIITGVVLRVAWVSDDSFITMRVIDNIVNGYGPRWNVSERVQVYTHPLWMAVILPFYWITREPAFTLIILSLGVTFITLLVFAFKVFKGGIPAFFGLSLLLSSKAFLEYSTSGLENPLTNLLICFLLLIVAWKDSSLEKENSKDGIWFGFIAAIMLLNRMDLAPLIGPVLLYMTFRHPKRWKCFGWAVVGGSPFLLWMLFSLIYYGQPFPNTAYAKLYTGIPDRMLWFQGLVYINQTIEHDFPTFAVILTAIISVFVFPNPKRIALGFGVLLSVIYVAKVGGDFMQGRFLVTPFFMSVMILSTIVKETDNIKAVFILPVLALSIFGNSRHPLIINHRAVLSEEKKSTAYQVIDERIWYLEANYALLTRDGELPYYPSAFDGQRAKNNGKEVVIRGDIGFAGYYGGPNVHIVDPFALSNAFLARLPVTGSEYQTSKVGHFRRPFPEGYIESIRSGENRIKGDIVAEFFNQIEIITKNPIFSGERIKAIYWLNIGKLDGARNFIANEQEALEISSSELFSNPPQEKKAWQDHAIAFSASGIKINLEDIIYDKQIEVSLSKFDRYRITVEDQKGNQVELYHLLVSEQNENEWIVYRLDLPVSYQENGVESVKLEPYWGDSNFKIGSIRGVSKD